MFRPKSILRVTHWIIGTGRVNSGGLSVKHAAALAWQCTFRNSQAFMKAYFIYILFFKCILSFSKEYIIMLTKQNLCWYVIFSHNSCFVANFVDKRLVNDRTSPEHGRVCGKCVSYSKIKLSSSPGYVLCSNTQQWRYGGKLCDRSTLTLRVRVRIPLLPGTFVLQQDTSSTLLLSTQVLNADQVGSGESALWVQNCFWILWLGY